MRRGEISMAGLLALFSLYLMWKSAELPIGYIRGEGPGGGAWPAVDWRVCRWWTVRGARWRAAAG